MKSGLQQHISTRFYNFSRHCWYLAYFIHTLHVDCNQTFIFVTSLFMSLVLGYVTNSLFFHISIFFFSNKLYTNSMFFLIMEFNGNDSLVLFEHMVNWYFPLSIYVREIQNLPNSTFENVIFLIVVTKEVSNVVVFNMLNATILGFYNFMKWKDG